MAKWDRQQIGKIVKKSPDRERFPQKVNSEGKVIDPGVREFSLKIDQDITLKAGSYLNLENKAFKLASLEANKAKMSEENYAKAVERINKMPDYVFFEVIKLDKEG
jgi:hypothetical protein